MVDALLITAFEFDVSALTYRRRDEVLTSL